MQFGGSCWLPPRLGLTATTLKSLPPSNYGYKFTDASKSPLSDTGQVNKLLHITGKEVMRFCERVAHAITGGERLWQ